MYNPFMSMWLSAFNSAAGQMQAFWSAEVQRQQHAYMREFRKAFDSASGGLFGSANICAPGARPRSRTGARGKRRG